MMHSLETKRKVLTEIIKTRINGHAPVIAISKQFNIPDATVSTWHLRLNKGEMEDILNQDEIARIELTAKSEWTEALINTRSQALDNMMDIHKTVGEVIKGDNPRDMQSAAFAMKEITKAAFDVYGQPIGSKVVDVNVNGRVEIDQVIRIVELPEKRIVQLPPTITVEPD